ncbi:MAG: alcohol dehydrogenase catalytic domain-containing protein [Eubacteriales bacterium]|nr:alcohol dehydrogenase catalytic domain-containing protein [Eubacteriales bacterium]
MKALKLFGPKDIRLVEVAVPEIDDNEILLKTEAAAICGTDIRMWQNGCQGVDETHPLTLGHEFSGVIEEVGKNVPFYQPGMVVGMQPNIGCGICDACVAGNFHLCEDYRAFGINMDGAFAEYIKIPSEAIVRGNLAVLPNGVSCEEAAVNEPLSCAYNGFTKCSVQPGEHALVVGAGPIGVMHAKLLHMAGAIVAMNDLSGERLEQCRSIMPFISTYCGDDLAAFTREFTLGRGLDIAITACPVPSVQAAMLPLMNYGGRVNFFGGIPEGKQPVPINTNFVHYKELFLTGSTRSSIAQFRRTLGFISQGLLDIRSVITDRYALNDITDAFENARQAKGIKHLIHF